MIRFTECKLIIDPTKSYSERTLNNSFSRTVHELVRRDRALNIDVVFDLCDTIKKLQDDLVDLTQKKSVTYVLPVKDIPPCINSLTEDCQQVKPSTGTQKPINS